MKKIIALIICICLCLPLFHLPANAAQELTDISEKKLVLQRLDSAS